MRIEGRNAVREALRAGVRISRLYVAQGTDHRGALADILRIAEETHIDVERLARPALDEMASTASHQGVIAEAPEFGYRDWAQAVRAARSRGEVPLVVALDGITDPQNLGSIVRSAEVFGAHAVITPARRAAPMTAAAAKASAGAVWHMPVDQVVNLNRALDACKKEGLWVLALDGSGATQVSNCPLLSEPCVLVVGAEGAGVSRLVRERADVVVRIPQIGTIDSLGAAVAAGVALYAVARARGDSAGST